MTAVETHRAQSPLTVVRSEMEKMRPQFAAALPKHIPTDRFMRVVMTAIQGNPELLECSRRSLFQASMRAAHDGLLPDGRDGAMVIRRDKNGTKFATWQIMVGGLRKKVRNSDEIATWDIQLVHARDEFDYELGDAPFIRHKPFLGADRGPLVGAYSVAVLKSGEKSREVMSIEEIRQIRDRYSDGWKAYKAKKIKSTPWADSEGEMARKTVARRHSKVLPMSTDLDELLRRDDDVIEDIETRPEAKKSSSLNVLDVFANGSNGQPQDDPSTGSGPQEPVEASEEPLEEDEPLDDTVSPGSEEFGPADAYELGRQARHDGRPLKALPPELAHTEAFAAAWERGWKDAT